MQLLDAELPIRPDMRICMDFDPLMNFSVILLTFGAELARPRDPLQGSALMKILIIGCGAVGIGLACSLYDAGAQVDLVARGKTAESIRRGGMERHGLFKDIQVPAGKCRVYENARESDGGYDYILVSAKTTGNADIAAALADRREDILAPSGLLVLAQNGFGNERAFLGAFPEERVFSASFAIGFQRPRPNSSELTVFSKPMLIGNLRGRDATLASPLAKAIGDGGIPSQVTDDIAATMWAKLLYNCALNPLSALLQCDYGGLVKSGETIAIMGQIIDEIFAVMHACGYHTFWEDSASYKKEFFGQILPPTYGHRSSTLQDMERMIPTEIESLNGAVVRLGAEYSVPTPCNAMIVRLIKAKESLYNYSK